MSTSLTSPLSSQTSPVIHLLKMAEVLYHKSRDDRDTETVHPVIDALWNLDDAQQEDVMDVERLKNMGVKMVVAPALDNDLIGFHPLYFDPFPAESLGEYRIPDRQKTPGDDMAIADYEPEKDKGRTRLLRKWDSLTRGDLLLDSLITGIYHCTFFEDKSQKRDKKVLEPLVSLTNLQRIV